MSECGYIAFYCAPCTRQAGENGRCAEHTDRHCECGALAVTDCGAAIGSSFCALPICGACEHVKEKLPWNGRLIEFDEHRPKTTPSA